MFGNKNLLSYLATMELSKLIRILNEKASIKFRIHPTPMGVAIKIQSMFKVPIHRAIDGFFKCLNTGKLKDYQWDSSEMRMMKKFKDNEQLRSLCERLELQVKDEGCIRKIL